MQPELALIPMGGSNGQEESLIGEDIDDAEISSIISDSPKHLLADKNLKNFGHREDVTIDDFRIIQVIGIGSYGRVALVQRIV